MSDIQHISAGGRRIAYVHHAGAAPGVMFFGGFKSDMSGTKATALEAHCKRVGRAYTRFDYSGHGESSGAFEDGTIGAWTEDALAVLDAVGGRQILVGSSMGGWTALLATLKRPERVAALLLIAPAPDFTRWGMWDGFDEAQRSILRRDGRLALPSDYSDEPYVITRALIEEGDDHLLLEDEIPVAVPVRILHGMRDVDVPPHISEQLVARLASDDVELTLVKSGDHRLSGPVDLARLTTRLDRLAEQVTLPTK